MNPSYYLRLRVLFGFVLLLFFILYIRVFYLTFFNKNIIEAKKDVKIQRGIIYDRRGIELALSHDSSTIGINPEQVYDPEFTAQKISPFVNIPPEKIKKSILEKENYFLLKREMENFNAQKIIEMGLPGVRLEKEYKRVYPNGALASNLIGFTGLDDNQALSGLESVFNNELLTLTDKEIPRGLDLYLTIDSLIQYRLELSLGKAFRETKSKKAIGIFMDVNNGKVLAMASFPNFDPNHYSEYSEEAKTNWAIRYVYEPGSTMKIFMAMILLNEKLIDFNEKFYCPGYIEFGSRLVRCTDQHGLVDIDEILQYSCNVGIIKAIKKVNPKVVYDYLKKFKFGQRTGFSNQESKGIFPSFKDWNTSTPYYLAIGQGIETTPLQLVTSAAGLVNNGRVHTPIIVSHISNVYGDIVKKYNSEPIITDISEETTKHILKAMTKVVSQGTGKNAFIQDYAIAGKTGTAQKSKPGRGYSDGLISASFLGFFPANKPRIVGVIIFDEPGGIEHTGGRIAAPVFKEVVESILPIIDYQEYANNYNLPEVTQIKEGLDLNVVPDLNGKSLAEVIHTLQKYDAKFKIYGSGFCTKQSPSKGEKYNREEIWSLTFE
jgi:cell division protein FtsI/penicillin-binding protein 2